MNVKRKFEAKSKILVSTLAIATGLGLLTVPMLTWAGNAQEDTSVVSPSSSVNTNNDSSLGIREEVASGTCSDGLTWSLDDAGVLTISGTGNMNDHPWLENYASSIKSLVVEPGVTSIYYYAFSECFNLTSVSLPNTLTTIEPYSFMSCYNLTNITIPASVTSIAGSAFLYCNNLTQINVDPGNAVYASEDGIVFSKDMKTLLTVPKGKVPSEYTISSSITAIGDFAFCDGNTLEKVTIPDTVTSISDFAFAYCFTLSTVYYKGSVEEWNAITIGIENEPLLEAEIYYNVCDPGMHVYTNYISNGDATCTTDGTETATCDICKVPDTRVDVDSKQHSFTNYIPNDDATCIAEGTMTAECDFCTATDTQPDVGSSKPHNYENGVCTVCGATQPTTTPTPSTGEGSYALWFVLLILSGTAIAAITLKFKKQTA